MQGKAVPGKGQVLKVPGAEKGQECVASREGRVTHTAVYTAEKHSGGQEEKDRPAADQGDGWNAPGLPGRAPSGRCLH
jgi:hypothetical protein